MVLLDYQFKEKLELVNETATQLTFECPICGGHSLKMNKTTKAYNCFSSGCSPIDIRKEIGLKTGSFFSSKETKVSNPVYVTKDNVCLQFSNINPPKSSHFFYKKYNQFAVKTTYFYDLNHKVDRIKLLGTKDKVFYPFTLIDGKWVISGKDFPLYNANLVQPSKTILFAEGEKCATQVSRFALCLTAPGFGSNSYKFLSSNINKIAYSVKNILIFSDPDSVGQKKAELLQRVCWEYFIPCSILKLDYKSGDIFDLIVDKGIDTSDKMEKLILSGL